MMNRILRHGKIKYLKFGVSEKCSFYYQKCDYRTYYLCKSSRRNRIDYYKHRSYRLSLIDTGCLSRHFNATLQNFTDSSSKDYLYKPGQDLLYKSTNEDEFCVRYDPSTLAENIYGSSVGSYLEKEELMQDKPDKVKKEKNISLAVKETSPSSAKQDKKKSNSTKSEHLKKQERHGYFSRSLRSYIQVCGNANMNQQAHDCLFHYRRKNEKSKVKNTEIDIDVYNALLGCWAAVGNMEKFNEVLAHMKKDDISSNLQTYAVHLECLSRCQNSFLVEAKVTKIAKILKNQGKSFSDIFNECVFRGDQAERIEKILKPHYEGVSSKISHSSSYTCELLQSLNEKKDAAFPYVSGCVSAADISELTSKQMELETDYSVKVKSVNASNSVTEKTLLMRKHVEACEKEFVKQLSSTLDAKLESLAANMKGKKSMALYPYLYVIEKDLLINVMLQEIRWIIESAEYFSPSLKILCQNMGSKVMNFYFIWLRKRNKVTDKVTFLYSKYLEYLLSPELSQKCSPREYWQHLKCLHFAGPTIDVPDVRWPHHIIYEVGKFLYDILLRHLLFDVNKLKHKTKHRLMVPPFYTIYERTKNISTSQYNFKLSLEIRAHPVISKLYREADLSNLQFDVSMVPMLCPPRPWINTEAGGLLMTQTSFIRLPLQAHHLFEFYSQVPSENLQPCFDSLNIVSSSPWIINKPVLDIIIRMFCSSGCEELDIPLNPTVHFSVPEVKSNMSDAEKKEARRQRAIIKKKRMEATSLWFDCLYKLSIANQFRDEIFWFPHNLDFRGRVYPTPPHFNHLGSDMVRSILLFAEGRPLGEKGLDWLKIHLINLTGFKKREPNVERLRYANEIMDDILDSADQPLTGKMWWKTSDEPWQTLACCMEVARAVRSADPEIYVTNFPIHQDGSCNGLQHYAALGRDKYGAREVNLSPSDSPQDVYSGVAGLVEIERKKNAAEGHEIAKILEGFIKRKVVKQTIMTFVYGVTEYGAKEQILKQLKDLPDFPEQHRNNAARYLVKLTFASIQKMFTATREIQKWFTDCAEVITRVTREPVEWITPLGLPVMQPYHKKAIVRNLTDIVKGNVSMYSSEYESGYSSTYEKYKLPNVRKQKNAFPPNFIHSLDSSHMMLTSLFCQRAGIAFVSVHDCYWTHPATVEIMNKICREQFVSLHSQPILEDLSAYFVKKYLNDYSGSGDNNKQNENLKAVLSKVPEKGTFDLNCILDSVYFFS